VQHEGDSEDMFAIALQVPLRAVKISSAFIQRLPLPKDKCSIKLLLAEQSCEAPAVIAAVLPKNQNAFSAAKNCWVSTSLG
jgi:hypothetical protein